MSRKILLVPLVAAPIAGVSAALCLSGMIWPIITTARAVFRWQRTAPTTEADPVC